MPVWRHDGNRRVWRKAKPSSFTARGARQGRRRPRSERLQAAGRLVTSMAAPSVPGRMAPRGHRPRLVRWSRDPRLDEFRPPGASESANSPPGKGIPDDRADDAHPGRPGCRAALRHPDQRVHHRTAAAAGRRRRPAAAAGPSTRSPSRPGTPNRSARSSRTNRPPPRGCRIARPCWQRAPTSARPTRAAASARRWRS